MGRKGRFLAAIAGLALFASIAATAASGAHRADPGVTSTTIHIGGTFPLTGVASLYKTIPAAEGAYFAYINAHGGVNGRKIDFTVLDDAYDPSKTVPLTQQLVEQDGIFADFGSLGTAPNLSIWSYLNQHKVPQVLIATGDSYWGFSAKKYPWTMGYQPDYPGEGKVYGKYISAHMPNAKIGVLYQNDAFGKNYFAGLRVGLGAKKSQIVSAQSYDPTQTSLVQQILALKASGADAFAIFALPSQAITALVTATKVGWTPTIFLGNVSANPIFLKIAAQNGANVNGVISTNYLVDTTAASMANLPGVTLAKSIISTYAPPLLPSLNGGDANVVYGLGAAWTFVYALQHAGKNPTRAGLMKALKSMNHVKDPFLYPGITLNTSAKDNFPTEQEILDKWEGGATGAYTYFGELYNNVR
ncbi:MAG TPA: ABC transporter substrate-binding protein [Gaiellaceae bacterium]|jgi:branched-chain amino acid transport system substrate-binding protein